MLERLKRVEERYNEINDLMQSSDVITDIKKMTELSKEQSSLRETYEEYQNYKKVINDIKDAEELLNDSEMAEMAKEELNDLYKLKEELDSKIEILLLPKDPNDDKDIIMEIRGAAGGDEANIFAGDLYRMYSYYAANNGWKIEEINSEECAAGGY